MTPVIGITTYEDQASWRGWAARAAILPYVYVDAVRRSGGRAVLLPPGGDDAEASATVADHALRQGVPLLAICRGMQILNVCRGGTLHQHIPDLVGNERHDGPPNGFGLHQVRISPDSTLATILTGGDVFEVPTKHHQSVD